MSHFSLATTKQIGCWLSAPPQSKPALHLSSSSHQESPSARFPKTDTAHSPTRHSPVQKQNYDLTNITYSRWSEMCLEYKEMADATSIEARRDNT